LPTADSAFPDGGGRRFVLKWSHSNSRAGATMKLLIVGHSALFTRRLHVRPVFALRSWAEAIS
jgi:hypothetical protein